MPGEEVGFCLAPWGPCWGGQRGTIPSSGLARGTHWHRLSHLGQGWGVERSRGGVVQVARDGHVLLTQVGTQLAASAMGKHTCLGRESHRAAALASLAARAGHAD